MAETPSFLVGYIRSGGDSNDTVGYSLAWAVLLGAALAGATLGSLQWLILRRQLTGMNWWTVASMVGFTLGFTLVWALSGARHGTAFGHHAIPHAVDGAGIVGGAVIGAVLGSMQLLLRRWRRSQMAWWMGATILGCTAGWAGAIAMPVTGVPAHFVGGATFGIVYGAVTGAALVWLLRQSAQPILLKTQNL